MSFKDSIWEFHTSIQQRHKSIEPRRLEIAAIQTKSAFADYFWFISYLRHPKLSHNENWSFGDLVLANCLQQRFAIAYQYFLVLVQNTTLNGDKNQKKPIVTPGGAECGLHRQFWTETQIKNGDRLEVVTIVGGG